MTMEKAAGRQEEITNDLVEAVLRAGADAADTVLFESRSLEVSYRLGKLEDLERSEAQDLGLRVFIGKQQASVSSNDFSKQSLDTLVRQALAMAKAAPEDPYCGLAPEGLLATSFPELDLVDTFEVAPEDLARIAAEAEDTALAQNGITNSHGSSASWGRTSVALATSGGFYGSYASTDFSIGCAVLAGQGLDMQIGYDSHAACHWEDMYAPADIGKVAAERALRALNPQKVKSQSVPVVYESRQANSLVSHFGSAILGSGVARKTTFLKDKMGERLFADGITIVDDPHRRRGLSSRPFDGEGVKNGASNLVDGGRLTTWLLDTASARQLGLQTTGHAGRSTGGPPSPSWSNLYMKPGMQSPSELMKDIKQGLFVNSMFGPTISWTTGDYSVGVSGIWIENGELTHPVNEVTIAGNLMDMFLNMTPANDLEFRYGTNAPTIRVEEMMVAGV